MDKAISFFYTEITASGFFESLNAICARKVQDEPKTMYEIIG